MTEKGPTANDPFNRWILSRLSSSLVVTNAGFDTFRIDEAANDLYRFFWNDFCDWYLEIAKTVLRDADDSAALVQETKATLAYVLETSMRALHPLMPYVTEELWQRLPKSSAAPATIALAAYPKHQHAHLDVEIETRIGLLQAVIGAARTIRSEHDIKRANKVPLLIRTDDAATRDVLATHKDAIAFLVNTSDLGFDKTGAARPGGTTMSVVPSAHGPIEVLVGLKGLVSAEEESARIEREIKRIDKEIATIDKKLAAKGFVDRAPKEVVEETQAQRRSLVEARARIDEAKALVTELQ